MNQQMWGLASPGARIYGEYANNIFSPNKELLINIALALGLDAKDVREVSLWHERGNTS